MYMCVYMCVYTHAHFENTQIMRIPPVWLVENISHIHSSYVLWNLFP